MNLQLDPHVKAVFDDIVAHTPDIGPTPSGDAVHLTSTPNDNGRRWLAVAAAVIVVLGVGALVAAQRRTADAPAVTGPPSSQQVDPTITIPEQLKLIGDELAAALGVDARVLVVNASTNPGLADSLREALTLSGYRAVQSVDAPNGTVLEESTMYTPPSAPLSLPNGLGPVLKIRWEEAAPPSSFVTTETNDDAPTVLVLGNDLSHAPWQDTPAPLVDLGIGRLVIVDATTNDRGHEQVNARAEALRAAGVEVAAILSASRPVEQTMLMPIGTATPWTFAVDELAIVGGFDTWTPDLINDPLPVNATAALIIGDK